MGVEYRSVKSGNAVKLLARQNRVAQPHAALLRQISFPPEAEKWIAEHHWLIKQSQEPEEESAQEP